MMYLPSLSAYHTLENSQGTLDPLGLYVISDRLAARLVPGLRERMKHPRYLTAMAVGAVICAEFEEDELAADGLSEPWQVYEWYIVSAFVKCFDRIDLRQLKGLPGREKTTKAYREGIPLTAGRYLKTPSVFGFHGVYRTLAKEARLMDDSFVGELGARLVDTWEKESGLYGFRLGLRGTTGYVFRNKLKDAVEKGMKLGAVAKNWYWDYFETIGEHLAPKSPGKKEANLLFEELTKEETPMRASLIRFLASDTGLQLAMNGSERKLHTALIKQQGPGKQLLLAIQAYEKVCSLIYNAFYAMLEWMEQHGKKGSITQLCKLAHVQKACKQLNEAFAVADQLIDPFTEEAWHFSQHFQQLRESYAPGDWVQLLFEHHNRVQKNKIPAGKAPWVLEHASGNYLLNTTQTSDRELNDEYVHRYRTHSLISFLSDLGKL
jgi:hypothetical protein